MPTGIGREAVRNQFARKAFSDLEAQVQKNTKPSCAKDYDLGGAKRPPPQAPKLSPPEF